MSIHQPIKTGSELPLLGSELPVAGTFREHRYEFATTITRGRNDREHAVTVSYAIDANCAPVGIKAWVDDGSNLLPHEWDWIEQDAADDAREMAEDCRDADLEAAVSYSRVAPL